MYERKVELERYGTRTVFKNPVKKKTGWITLNMAKSFKKAFMKLPGY